MKSLSDGFWFINSGFSVEDVMSLCKLFCFLFGDWSFRAISFMSNQSNLYWYLCSFFYRTKPFFHMLKWPMIIDIENNESSHCPTIMTTSCDFLLHCDCSKLLLTSCIPDLSFCPTPIFKLHSFRGKLCPDGWVHTQWFSTFIKRIN